MIKKNILFAINVAMRRKFEDKKNYLKKYSNSSFEIIKKYILLAMNVAIRKNI